MKKIIGTRVPEEIYKEINYLASEEKLDKSKIIRDLLIFAVKQKLLEIALKKYSKREVSLGKAAELARIPLADFMKFATENKISINYSIESLKEDFDAALKLK